MVVALTSPKPALPLPSPSGLRRRCRLRGPLHARRGEGGRAGRSRVEVREATPAAADAPSRCGRPHLPPPRRGAGGHARRCRRLVEVREAPPDAAALRCGWPRLPPLTPCRDAGGCAPRRRVSWPEGRARLTPWLGHQLLDEMFVSLVWW
jgi:hypothetical protein